MLNSANYNSFSDLFTDNLNTNHLNLKLMGGGGGGLQEYCKFDVMKF